jgi:hypothetical protein
LAQLNILHNDLTIEASSTSQLTKPELLIEEEEEDSHWIEFRRDMFGEDLFDMKNPYF